VVGDGDGEGFACGHRRDRGDDHLAALTLERRGRIVDPKSIDRHPLQVEGESGKVGGRGRFDQCGGGRKGGQGLVQGDRDRVVIDVEPGIAQVREVGIGEHSPVVG
jgi:hypothetical protein